MPNTPACSIARCAGVLALAALVAAGCGDSRSGPSSKDNVVASRPDSESKLKRASELSQRGQFEEALSLIQEVLIAAPEDRQAMELALQLHANSGQFSEAGDLAAKLAQQDEKNAPALLIRAFDWHLQGGKFAAAEENLKQLLRLDPQNVQAHRLLAQLLNGQGRRYEASKHVHQLIRLHAVNQAESLSLIELSHPFLLVSYDGLVDPSQTSLFQLGQARREFSVDLNRDEALATVRQVRESFPESTAAAAFEGRVLIETGQLDQFARWLGSLPAAIEDQPEYWRAIGDWLSLQDRSRESIRAYGEALLRDPTDRHSLRGLIHAMELVGDEIPSTIPRDRLDVLDKIFRVAKDADAVQAAWIATQLQEQLRPWESSAWLMHSAQMSGQLQQYIPQLTERHEAMVAWEQKATAEQIRAARLERLTGLKIEQWPLPKIDLAAGRTKQPATADLVDGLKFSDVAKEVGMDVKTETGFPLDGGKFFPFQVNGGGLAVIDYDLDGRCDIYIVQSGGKPNDPRSSTANQFFRLTPDQRFSDVTESTLTGDRSYGQGVCAGDVNQDGFPDLLVANIGANVCYINQGDGTFRRADDWVPGRGDRWTSSLGLGDLDGDHLPEIVEVNYIDDPEAFQISCSEDYLACQPQRFGTAADRIYRSLPDGTFASWTDAGAKLSESPRLGFGLIIADFNRKQGNDLFITNDADPNHYWTSAAASGVDGAPFHLVDSAGVCGCGVGRDGDSQACMGIASGDFNRDGTFDLHVTNFHNEPSNLFLQSRTGFFLDQAVRYHVYEPSLGVLGFGTQAADFDNDGWLDMAVLNGHVYDARHEGMPFRMLPQLMRGSDRGFVSQDPQSAGPYWQQKRLGRTLAVFDWNRDGRIDLLGNHLDSPIMLLQNDSPSQNWLQIETVGVISEREAIGAEVVVHAGGETWTAWQVGGDGLMCTNESVIHFGLGSAQSVDHIQVKWPSGTTQTFDELKLNSRYLIIEQEETVFQR